MPLLKCITLAAFIVTASSAVADDARDQGLVGAWKPSATDAHDNEWTVLVFNDAGRFAALVAHGPESLDAASGSWALAEDGGEVVLAFDNRSTKPRPGTTRYLQMLLLGDELRPYPGMANRSPIAATSWHRVDDAFAAGPEDRASR